MESNINTHEYWEHRFSTNWELFGGKQQTLFFTTLAVNSLPNWIIEDISQKKLNICDIGCAEGEGSNLLAQLFPESDITGIDFSKTAITKAKNSFSHLHFTVGDITDFQEEYDIIFTSNTLEHFSNPLKLINNLTKNTRKYLIILIPFQEEEPLTDEHFFSFDYTHFNLKINEFYMVYFQEIDCTTIHNTRWAGKQLLLVYANKETVDLEGITLENYIGKRCFN